MIERIKKLSEAFGAPGFEDDVQNIIREEVKQFGEVKTDSMLNLYLDRKENKGNLPKVQLDAHMDEVALMVQYIKPEGTLGFLPLGSWVVSNLGAQKMTVKTQNGYISGVVTSKPPHFLSEAERKAPPEMSNLSVDIGVSTLEEARELGVRIAAPMVPDVKLEYIEDRDLLIGKAFDCRLGCAAIIGALEALQGKDLKVDVTAAFSVQEEMGVRGATVTAKTVLPDVAIVFEGTPADDTFEPSYKVQTAIGKGPMLRHIDARMITNPRFQRFALDLAEKQGIPVQEAVRSGGSTNGAAIHLTDEGVPTIVIGIPVRYIHTHHGIAKLSDVENAVRLATEIISSLDQTIISSF